MGVAMEGSGGGFGGGGVVWCRESCYLCGVFLFLIFSFVMKKIFYLASLAVLAGAVCVGCSKKEEAKKDSEQPVAKEVVEESVPEAPKTELKYVGTINGKYPIHLIVSADRQSGAYYYDKSGAKNYMRIRFDEFDEDGDGSVEFDEYNADGERTGSFKGKLTAEGMSGEGTFFSGKTMPFELKVYEGDDEFPSAEWDLTAVSVYSDDADDSVSGGSDIDDLLDEYAEFMDEYVDYAKSGNVDAAKLASLQSKATSIANKLQSRRSELTPAQLKKMSEIAAKALNAL